MTKKQQELLEALQQTARAKNWQIVGQRDIDNAIQFYIERGKDDARISLYTKGGIIVQGKQRSLLRQELEAWRDEHKKPDEQAQSLSLWDQ